MVPMNLRLFCGEYNKPVKPKVGLEIGQLTYSGSQIKLWINLYCFFENKACRLSNNSCGKRKVFVCSDVHNECKPDSEKCQWKIAISNGKGCGW